MSSDVVTADQNSVFLILGSGLHVDRLCNVIVEELEETVKLALIGTHCAARPIHASVRDCSVGIDS